MRCYAVCTVAAAAAAVADQRLLNESQRKIAHLYDSQAANLSNAHTNTHVSGIIFRINNGWQREERKLHRLFALFSLLPFRSNNQHLANLNWQVERQISLFMLHFVTSHTEPAKADWVKELFQWILYIHIYIWMYRFPINGIQNISTRLPGIFFTLISGKWMWVKLNVNGEKKKM